MDIVELQLSCSKLLSALRKLEETASFIAEGLPEYDISGGALVSRLSDDLNNVADTLTELRDLITGDTGEDGGDAG